MHWLSVFLSLVLSWHHQLYEPAFPKLPIVTKLSEPLPLTLTVPTEASSSPPLLQAKSYLLLDEQSGEVLVSKDSDTRLFPASTTKIMTALVVLNHFPLESVASVSGSPRADGSQMGLVSGEQITIKDLLAGLLIQSANDAALVLAAQYPGGQTAFIKEMNVMAQKLGLVNTFYTNPIGYSEPGHVTTVRDLVILSKEAMKNPEFASLVKTQQLTVYSVDGTKIHPLRTTNELLGVLPGIDGIKTGWTEESGECLVVSTTRNGRTLYSAVLNSPNRFKETTELIEWGYQSSTAVTKPLFEW
ncbi:D-alanyl-D-alanine carboxypeptidase [Candidatus Woesebacteria bacterium]|nr:D-alanyl-D-alanine carboxypeptidase [Candidatus Woesebacteria bacterium]